MSDRGSFVTEYIYCQHCLAAVKKALFADDKETGDVPFKTIWAVTVPSWKEDEVLPIVAGRVGSSYGGGELSVFDNDFRDSIEAHICCTVRIAVIAESGQEMLTFNPKKGTP